ncbi:MAG: holo-ACP synthase [Hyphomicrobiaceae bacterium]|nr:holo-ACP synthase [Hyphomicrobiaceae bacterium]
MILGIGNDICDARRIEKTLERFGERFLDRVYTARERERAFRKANPVATVAKRFAAKEACSKALGTGMRQGVAWRDMGVTNRPSGQPTLILTGGAARRLEAMTPEGMQAHIHLTMTDDGPLSMAVVIIEALPLRGL